MTGLAKSVRFANTQYDILPSQSDLQTQNITVTPKL